MTKNINLKLFSFFNHFVYHICTRELTTSDVDYNVKKIGRMKNPDECPYSYWC